MKELFIAFVIVALAILFIYKRMQPDVKVIGNTTFSTVNTNKITTPVIVNVVPTPTGIKFNFYGNGAVFDVMVAGVAIKASTDGSTVFSYVRKSLNLYEGYISSVGLITFQVGSGGMYSAPMTTDSGIGVAGNPDSGVVSTADTRLGAAVTVTALSTAAPVVPTYLINADRNLNAAGEKLNNRFVSYCTNRMSIGSIYYIRSLRECMNSAAPVVGTWEAAGQMWHKFNFEPEGQYFRIWSEITTTVGDKLKCYLAMHHEPEINNNAVDELRVYALPDVKTTYNGIDLLTRYNTPADAVPNDLFMVYSNDKGFVIKNVKYGLYIRCQITTSAGYLTAPFVVITKDIQGNPTDFKQYLPTTEISNTEFSIPETFVFLKELPTNTDACVV